MERRDISKIDAYEACVEHVDVGGNIIVLLNLSPWGPLALWGENYNISRDLP